MDHTWVSVIVGIVSSLFTGVIVAVVAFHALKTSLARIEERHNALAARCEEDRALLAMTKEVHDKRLATHELEIGLLKRGQPLDYAR